MAPVLNVDPDKPLPKLLGLVALAAIFAGAVTFAVRGVRDWPLGAGPFLEVAALIWGAFVVVGIGGAWLVSRVLRNPTTRP